ncbi:MAG: hypothetical protein JWO71_4267 [Candidatus Acidoferrum typicum]|nr:hypothetical protein [Candidatus Acidoferrum typicum]
MVVPDRMVAVEEAYDDLLRRTLSKIDGDLARLIYLASTRDYNTGKYHHDGLAARFQEENAGQALELAHREIFYRIAASSLQELVDQVAIYVSSSRQGREEVLQVWQKLEPYRVALPVDVNLAVAQLFVSNIKLALAILRQRYRREELEPSRS